MYSSLFLSQLLSAPCPAARFAQRPLPAPEAHSDELLDRADKQVTQLKAEVERLKQAGAPDVEDRRKLGQVVRLLENAFDQKNFKKAEKGTDYFVTPVYLEMLLYKVKEICS